MLESGRARAFLLRLGVTPVCAAVLVAYIITCAAIEWHLPAGESLLHNPFFDILLQAFFALCCLGFLLVRDIRKQPRWRDLGFIIGSFVLTSGVLYTFCYVKSLIPYFHPYGLDPWLQRIDIFLHGGTAPFFLLAPYINDRMIAALDMLYYKPWFIGMMLYMLWQCFCVRNAVGRTAFLSSFIMCWVLLGNLLATLLSSVGPTYYPLFYQDQFTALNQSIIDRIYAVHTHFPLADAVGNREQLLAWYHNSTVVDLNVMSSMPSLHTAIAILIALHSCRFAPLLAIIALPYAMLMFLGSILLGWHYAIDTYVSGICVYAIWRLNLRQTKLN